MCATNDGFRIAEEDLKLRGPGDIEGTKQSGAISLKLADLVNDGQILELARTAAFELIERDPSLQEPKHKALLNFVNKQGKTSLWAKIG
jgi:ATP-dependent DNA helicase RecG